MAEPSPFTPLRVSPQSSEAPPTPPLLMSYEERGAPIGGVALAGGLRFHFGIFLWSLMLVAAWMAMLIFVLPRFQEIFADYKMELPSSTQVLISLRKLVLYGGFVLLFLVPVVLGFVSGPLLPGGRRAMRMLVTLFFGLAVGFTILGIAQPLVMLMEHLGSGGGA
jgi:hypothetical protein